MSKRMQWDVLRTKMTESTSFARVLTQQGIHFALFGDEFFVFGASITELRTMAETTGVTKVKGGEIPQKNFHLVVQKGRSFQRANPEVQVLLDRGRFLVVNLSPSDARRFSEKTAEACFAITPLPQGVIYENLPKTVSPITARALAALAEEVDSDSIIASIRYLASFPDRLSGSAGFHAAAEWAMARFRFLRLETEFELVNLPDGSVTANVVATRRGEGTTLGRIIVTAHLDSINHADGLGGSAPGADDNASGVAGVLELARILAPRSFDQDLTFVLFGGEEQGLFGSRSFVTDLDTAEKARILGVVNMDMIGCRNTTVHTVMLEGAALSQPLIDELAAAATTHTELAVQVSLNPFASDHVPFIEAGIPAVLIIEGNDSANDSVHSAADIPDRIDAALATKILRMGVSVVASLAGLRSTTALPPPKPCDCISARACSGLSGDTERVLVGHLNQILALYRRLHSQGLLELQDHEDWQVMLRLRDTTNKVVQELPGTTV